MRGQRSASPVGSTWLPKSPSEYPPPKWGPWGRGHVSQYSNTSDSGGLSQKALCSRQRVARHARCRRGSAVVAGAASQSPAPWLPLRCASSCCAGEVRRRCRREITVRTRSGIPAWARKLSHGRGFPKRPWLGSVWSLRICGCDAVLLLAVTLQAFAALCLQRFIEASSRDVPSAGFKTGSAWETSLYDTLNVYIAP